MYLTLLRRATDMPEEYPSEEYPSDDPYDHSLSGVSQWGDLGWVLVIPCFFGVILIGAIIMSCADGHKRRNQQRLEESKRVAATRHRTTPRSTAREVSARDQTQRSGESSGRPAPTQISPPVAEGIQVPQNVAQPAGRSRVDAVDDLSPAELPPSYEARVRDELYHEDESPRNPLESSAPPYMESDPSSNSANSNGREAQPLQVLTNARAREGIFVRRDEAGREWVWDGERLIVS